MPMTMPKPVCLKQDGDLGLYKCSLGEGDAQTVLCRMPGTVGSEGTPLCSELAAEHYCSLLFPAAASSLEREACTLAGSSALAYTAAPRETGVGTEAGAAVGAVGSVCTDKTMCPIGTQVVLVEGACKQHGACGTDASIHDTDIGEIIGFSDGGANVVGPSNSTYYFDFAALQVKGSAVTCPGVKGVSRNAAIQLIMEESLAEYAGQGPVKLLGPDGRMVYDGDNCRAFIRTLGNLQPGAEFPVKIDPDLHSNESEYFGVCDGYTYTTPAQNGSTKCSVMDMFTQA